MSQCQRQTPRVGEKQLSLLKPLELNIGPQSLQQLYFPQSPWGVEAQTHRNYSCIKTLTRPVGLERQNGINSFEICKQGGGGMKIHLQNMKHFLCHCIS